MEKNTHTHTQKNKALEAEKLGEKFDVNGDLEEERLFRAQAEENHPGKSLVPRLCCRMFYCSQTTVSGQSNQSSVSKFCSGAAAPLEWSTESHESSALVGCSVWAVESIFPFQQLLQSHLSSLLCTSVHLGVCIKPGCACKNYFAFDSSTDIYGINDCPHYCLENLENISEMLSLGLSYT